MEPNQVSMEHKNGRFKRAKDATPGFPLGLIAAGAAILSAIICGVYFGKAEPGSSWVVVVLARVFVGGLFGFLALAAVGGISMLVESYQSKTLASSARKNALYGLRVTGGAAAIFGLYLVHANWSLSIWLLPAFTLVAITSIFVLRKRVDRLYKPGWGVVSLGTLGGAIGAYIGAHLVAAYVVSAWGAVLWVADGMGGNPTRYGSGGTGGVKWLVGLLGGSALAYLGPILLVLSVWEGSEANGESKPKILKSAGTRAFIVSLLALSVVAGLVKLAIST